MNPYDKKDLLPGDVLLHSSGAPISLLIEWAGDSDYSHAAVVYDATSLREASAAGIRSYDLATRLADTTDYRFIDAYRYAPNGIVGDQVTAMRRVADGYMGNPYPLNELFFLGMACAVRDKVPVNAQLRLLLHKILDDVVDPNPHWEVCSEFVYRCYAEAKATPSMKARIVLAPLKDTPFPHIDMVALIEEIIAAYRQAHKTDALVPLDSSVSEDQLRARYARLREKLGPPVIDNPNPRLILPVDLMDSPDFMLLGRVTGPT